MSNKKEFFQFRINKIKIHDNKERGKNAEVKLISFVTTSDIEIPIIDGIFKTTDENEKKEIIKSATQSVLSKKILNEIHNVQDDHVATFGHHGYSLYTADKIPRNLDWFLMAIEIDDDVRNIGKSIDSIVNKNEFDTFSNELIPTLLGLGEKVALAPYVAGAKIAKFIVSNVSNLLKGNKDDNLGVYYLSFNRFEHYPHGVFNEDDVLDLSRNLKVDYSIFGTEYEE